MNSKMTGNIHRHVLISCMMSALVAIQRCAVGFSPTLLPCNTKLESCNSRDMVMKSWKLYNLIEAVSEDYVQPEEGQGGVRLAKESAIKVVGNIQHKPGKAESFPQELLRFKNLKSLEEDKINNILKKVGSTVLGSGQGVELYKDPGETTMKEVYYAPTEAIKDAITNTASAMESNFLVFNFLGGDDLILGEVMDAGSELVLMLDIPTKTKISFNSLSHRSIPSGTCSVTVVSVSDQPNDEESFTGVEKAVALGEVYTRDGSWYTVEESDINTAVT